MFAFLSNVGFIQASSFIKPYNSTLSECLRNPGMIYTVFFASFFANILSFPGVHTGAFSLVCDSLKGFFSSKNTDVLRAQTHRQTVNKVKCSLLAEMSQLMSSPKNLASSSAALKSKLNALFSSADGLSFSLLDWSEYMLSADKSVLSQAIISYDQNQSRTYSAHNVSPLSMTEKSVKCMLNILFFAVLLKGFYNFIGMWRSIINVCEF